MTPDPYTCRGCTVFIAAQTYTPYSAQTYRKGFKAVLASQRRNSQSSLPRVKSTNYLESLLAKMEAKMAGADEALFLNERGFVAEASACNIFLVMGGVLLTPPLSSGILPGITREVVLELASTLGIPVREQEVGLKDLFKAEEAFLTNSILEIMPLTNVEGRSIGRWRLGRVTRELRAAYRQLVKAVPEGTPMSGAGSVTRRGH